MEKFKKGDVVWAKIRGYPWWPGIVSAIFPALVYCRLDIPS